MKKVEFMVLILIVSILGNTFLISAESVKSFSVGLESKTVSQGETFDVDININANSGITMLRLYVEYDSSVLALIDVKDKGILGDCTVSDDKNSPFCMVWLDGVNNYYNTGTIATLTFTATEELSQDIVKTAVKITTKSKNDILNDELESVTPQFFDGNITILSSAIVLGKTTKTLDTDGYSGIWIAEQSGTFMLTMDNNACVDGWAYTMTCNDYTYSFSTGNGESNKNICYMNVAKGEKLRLSVSVPSQTESSVTFVTAFGTIKGDADCDGLLSTGDLVLLRKLLLGCLAGSEKPTVCNANGDEDVNVIDLVRLKKNLANMVH